MVAQIERTAEGAHRALLDTARSEEEKIELESKWKLRKGPTEDLKKHRQFFMEIILVRLVENYLNYLSSLLREVFVARPESLRSSEKVDLETVLRHESIDDFVRTVAERKVESLSYSSFDDLAEYFVDRFNIELAGKEKHQAIVQGIETRNISVHNRCIVNTRFVAKTNSHADRIGKLRVLGIENVETIGKVLSESVISVDRAARKKLRIPGHQFKKILAG